MQPIRIARTVFTDACLSGIGKAARATSPSAEPYVPLSGHTAPRSNTMFQMHWKLELRLPHTPMTRGLYLAYGFVSVLLVCLLRSLPHVSTLSGWSSDLSGGLWLPRAFRLPAFASWGILSPLGCCAALAVGLLIAQTPSGLPRSAYPTQRRRLRLSPGGASSAPDDT